jgi:hypothetical protein
MKMSNSSLLLLPESEPSLPTLPIALFFQPQGIRQPVKPQLANLDSILFTRGLFSCTVIDGTSLLVQLCSLQPNCNYTPKLQPLSYKHTGDYWTHYNYSHPTIIATARQQQRQSTLSTDNKRRLLCMRDWGVLTEEPGTGSNNEVKVENRNSFIFY